MYKEKNEDAQLLCKLLLHEAEYIFMQEKLEEQNHTIKNLNEEINALKKLYGNKCQICGYNKCSSALEFHHLNPEEKEGIVSNSYGTIKESLKEAKKCILICANCHREVHEKLIEIPEALWKEVLI